MDHIGFGLSDKPEGFSYLPREHARNLQLFLDSLVLTDITLVVQDWGGPTGLSYALNNPERVRRADHYVQDEMGRELAAAVAEFMGGD